MKYNQDYAEIKEELRRDNELFEDPAFSIHDEILSKNVLGLDIEWRRPHV